MTSQSPTQRSRVSLVKGSERYANVRKALDLIAGDSRLQQAQRILVKPNLCRLAWKVKPHLSVIDGFEAMEGDGPVGGIKVSWGIALASLDPLAADTVVSSLMGFPIEQVGYLHYCRLAGLGQGDLSEIDIVGEDLATCARHFRPHQTYDHQLKWQLAGAERYLN